MLYYKSNKLPCLVLLLLVVGINGHTGIHTAKEKNQINTERCMTATNKRKMYEKANILASFFLILSISFPHSSARSQRTTFYFYCKLWICNDEQSWNPPLLNTRSYRLKKRQISHCLLWFSNELAGPTQRLWIEGKGDWIYALL